MATTATASALTGPASSSAAAVAATSNNLVAGLPWYIRYFRWRQTSRQEAVEAEKRLLGVRGAIHTEVRDVELPDGNIIHTYHAMAPGSTSTATPMVCLPGYGAGAGFYWKNMEGLSKNQQVFAVDPLGTGLSSRPSFKARDTQQAEDFFVGSLSAWRQEMGLDKMILVGHSMGGYLATCYALKYPEHVKHLVLVSPAGIPEMPTDWEPKAVQSAMTVSGLLWRAAKSVWDNGLTPGAVTRSLGPWGPGLVHKYVSRRFSTTGEGLTEDEVEAFRDYQYHILAQNGSGEHALRHILQPFAWAKNPLENRIPELRVPVTFIYGDKDWMLNIDKDAPNRAVQKMNLAGTNLSPIAAAPLHQEVLTIRDAGHYLFIDQPEEFHSILRKICEGHSS